MTIPTYRYFTADVLTGAVQAELPLYGVAFDRQIKNGGNFTGTFKLGTGIEDDAVNLDGSIPQKTAIYCQRNGTTIWGGIIGSRTFESNAKTVQLSAQTFEAYFGRVLIKSNFINTGINQLTIMKNLVDLMQSNPRSNLGIDTTKIIIDGGNVKSLAVAFYDYRYFADAISELADADDGFDWYIDVQDGPIVDQPVKTLVVGQPFIAPNDQSNVSVYDYPGSIDQFYWPESGSKTGTDFIVLGNGAGSNMLVAVGTWPGSSLYPETDQVFSYKDINDINSLSAIAQSVAMQYGPAVSNPTITLKSDADPEFDGWSALGAYYRFVLESVRFPDGPKTVTKRVLGWALSPASSEQTETLSLVIEGEDDTDA